MTARAAAVRRTVLATLALVFIVGTSVFSARHTDRTLRADLLRQAKLAAAGLSPDRVAALTGTPDDLGLPPYRLVKERLADVQRTVPGCRFAYLMARRADDAIVFLVDNEPDDSPDCSPPGQNYTNLTETLLSVLDDNRSAVEGPHADPWGTWVSALVPVAFPEQKYPVLLGLDVEAHRWKWIVVSGAAIPAGLAAIAILLGLLALELLGSRRELRQRQTQLAESERRFAELAELSRTIVWEVDPQGRYTYTSAACASILGYRPDEMVGQMHFYDLHPPEGGEDFKRHALQMIARAEKVVNVETAVRAKDGHRVWLLTNGVPVLNADGSLRGHRGSNMDITARKNAEHALRENDLKLRALFAAMTETVALHEVVFDDAGAPRDYRLTDVNEAFSRLTGLKREDAVGKLASEVYHAVPPPYLAEYAQVAISGTPCRFESHYAPLDKHLQISAMPLGLNRFATITADVTASKRAEERLHALLEESNQARRALLGILEDHERSEADLKRLATAIEQSADSIVVTDATARIQYVNPAFEAVTGYRREEAIGQNPRILQSGQQDAAFYRQLWTVLAAGQPWKGRFVNRRKDGGLYTEDAVISPVFDAQSQIVNYVAVKRDVSEQLRQAAQLQQAQKMDSIGRLAGGVAHDFNNMLTIILGHAEMKLADANLAPDTRASFEEIRRAAVDSAALTRQLLAFARQQTIAPRRIDLNETVGRSIQMLRRLIGENVGLAWTPAKTVPPVQADPAQIDQILVNLCVNARDAIAGSGRIDIDTGAATLDADFCAKHPGAVPGEYVRISVRDTGCGMDAETLAHAFEPFYTTKPTGAGTGLGLSTVYGIVKQNAGYIDVASKPGHGTSIHIYLPRSEAPAPAAPIPAVPVPAAASAQTVLLVEDEPAILAVAAQMLSHLGYIVRAAHTPAEAIRVAKEHPGPIHLLLTDVVMPGLNGRDLAKTLGDLRPGLRTLFMSGYNAEVIARNGILDAQVQFVRKPFTRDELAAKIRDVLGA